VNLAIWEDYLAPSFFMTLATRNEIICNCDVTDARRLATFDEWVFRFNRRRGCRSRGCNGLDCGSGSGDGRSLNCWINTDRTEGCRDFERAGDSRYVESYGLFASNEGWQSWEGTGVRAIYEI